MPKTEVLNYQSRENERLLNSNRQQRELGSFAVKDIAKRANQEPLLERLGLDDKFALAYDKMYDNGEIKTTDPIKLNSGENIQFIESSFYDRKQNKTRNSITSVMYDDKLHRIGYMSGMVLSDETVVACGASYGQDYRNLKKMMPDNLQKVMYDVDTLETHSVSGPYHGQDKSGDIVYSYLAYLQERGYSSLVAGSIDADDVKGRNARYKVAKNLEHYKVDDLVDEGKVNIITMFR
jgi:hypothetical protein